jgi:hypothetical protein
MTLATMTNDLLRFVPGLHPSIIKSTIQDSYQVLAAKDWNRLKIWKEFPTTLPYSTGKITITSGGVVTGIGTSFIAGMVGRYLRVDQNSYYPILTVTPGTTLTLGQYNGVAVVTGINYTIFQTIYPLDASMRLVWDMVHQINLKKMPQNFFNKVDPTRNTSSSTPEYWAYAGVVNDVMQVEIYPPLTSVCTIRYYGKAYSTTLGDSETPLLPEHLIKNHALLSCYQIKDVEDPGKGWEKKMVAQAEIYKDSLATFQEEDSQLGDPPGRVIDSQEDPLFPMDDNFALSHDVD